MKTDDPSMLFTSDGHPDENLLFLAIERDLAPEEAAQIEGHLGACWACRVRSEEMQKGISAFMEYREKRFAPMLPAPPNQYRNFAGRLQVVAQESAAPGSAIRWLKALWNRLVHFVFPSQLKWASVVAGVMAMVILYVQVINPPSLSADQLLTRAEAAQDFRLADKPGRSRIVRQTVQITVDGKSAVKTFTWTTGEASPTTHWGGEQAWNAPLTAAGFAEWRRSLDEKTDKVKRSGDFWLLDTAAPHNFIREATLTVRAADFHPLEQHLRFRDDRELTIKELGFDIQEQAPHVPESLLEQEPRVAAQAAEQVTGTPTPQPAVNLDETELQLRYELFKHQWDLGEELAMSQSGGDVVINGTVSSQEREASLRAALGALQHVRVETNAPNITSLPAPSPRSSTPTQKPTGAPLLQSLLEDAFPSKEGQAAFVEDSLAASDAAVSHAWALKRLADRYDNSQMRKLSQDARSKLAEILQGHLQQLNQSNAALDRLLSLLPPAAGSVKVSARDWRNEVLALFGQVEQQDHAVTAFLARTPGKTQDLSAITSEFESSHRMIGALLRRLDNIKLDSPEPGR